MQAVQSYNEKYLRDCRIARQKADSFWKKTKTIGPVAIPAATLKVLQGEERTVYTLFAVMAQMALGGNSDYLRADGTAHGTRIIVTRPGGRRWDQRSLAVTAGMSVGSVNLALKRLKELGLIFLDTSRKWGTFVLIKNFERLTNTKFWRAAVKTDGPPRQPSGVSVNGTFLLSTNTFYRSTDLVDVSKPEADQKEGGTLEKKSLPDSARADLARLFPEVPDWAR